MSTDIPDNADAENEAFLDDDGVLYDEEVTPEFGILGFTLRELSIAGVWLIAFVVSFFPLTAGASIWGAGIQWILPIGVPTAAVFLLVLRRFSPDGIRRVGSLGIDQFASVAFTVSAVTWISALWASIAASIEFGVWTLNWVGIVQLLASLALVVLTVFAPIIPGLKEDFHGRLVTLAHRNANPVRPVIARPRAERPAPAEAEADAVPESFVPESSESESIDSEPAASHESPAPDESWDGAEPPTTRRAALDADTPDGHATDEIARFDLPQQVPLAAHASGGGTGTGEAVTEEEYTPSYSRRSRTPEIISDTGEIESFLEEVAEPVPAPAGAVAEHPTDVFGDDSIVSDPEATQPRDPAQAAQPFWILAPSERDVHDERGEAIFRIGPQAWALVIEDRGGAFVVRHDDGRIGYLHDISGITKG
ncbi:hypothetical protein ACIQTT_00395 [Microbacterium sp. NPDC090225]|uniref:hypothetical protein n=1 Tax=Microbacterium sp. NPDC090225 TaxID=3364207 RepID=UPI003830F8D2